MKINVLGTKYNLKFKTVRTESKLEGCVGFCDYSTKELIVDKMIPDENSMANLPYYKRKVIRHEIIHAFLMESGLDVNSDWATNEEMVDFFAMQIEKMYKAFREAEALEEFAK